MKTLLLHNIDTLGADVDPVLLGQHLGSGAALSFEVITRRLEDRGGGLARGNGRPRLVEGLATERNTEKTSCLLEPKNSSSAAAESPEPELSAPAGHGRNAASAFTGAETVPVQHAQLKPGDPCPECRAGRVYRQKKPKTRNRIGGPAPGKK